MEKFTSALSITETDQNWQPVCKVKVLDPPLLLIVKRVFICSFGHKTTSMIKRMGGWELRVSHELHMPESSIWYMWCEPSARSKSDKPQNSDSTPWKYYVIRRVKDRPTPKTSLILYPCLFSIWQTDKISTPEEGLRGSGLQYDVRFILNYFNCLIKPSYGKIKYRLLLVSPLKASMSVIMIYSQQLWMFLIRKLVSTEYLAHTRWTKVHQHNVCEQRKRRSACASTHVCLGFQVTLAISWAVGESTEEF